MKENYERPEVEREDPRIIYEPGTVLKDLEILENIKLMLDSSLSRKYVDKLKRQVDDLENKLCSVQEEALSISSDLDREIPRRWAAEEICSNSDVSASAKMAYLTVLNVPHSEYTAGPFWISFQCGLSKEYVESAVRELAAKGYLSTNKDSEGRLISYSLYATDLRDYEREIVDARVTYPHPKALEVPIALVKSKKQSTSEEAECGDNK